MNIAKNHWVTFKCCGRHFITLTGACDFLAIWNILQHFTSKFKTIGNTNLNKTTSEGRISILSTSNFEPLQTKLATKHHQIFVDRTSWNPHTISTLIGPSKRLKHSQFTTPLSTSEGRIFAILPTRTSDFRAFTGQKLTIHHQNYHQIFINTGPLGNLTQTTGRLDHRGLNHSNLLHPYQRIQLN